MTKYTQQQLEDILSKGIHKVEFVKATDATLCTMICTRDFDWLRTKGISSEMNYADPKGGKCYNEALKVWCIEIMEEGENWKEVKKWRSFYPECVQSIEKFSSTSEEEVIIEEI